MNDDVAVTYPTFRRKERNMPVLKTPMSMNAVFLLKDICLYLALGRIAQHSSDHRALSFFSTKNVEFYIFAEIYCFIGAEDPH